MPANPLSEDLEGVLRRTRPLWEELRGRRLFLTGGTGFFGCWLLESFSWANQVLDLKAEVVVLTRDPAAFHQKAPHLALAPGVHLHAGDVRDFTFPAGAFSHVIHAATEASDQLNRGDPGLMLETIVAGTRRALEMAQRAGAKKFLLTSSGAVYGAQPAELIHVPEEYIGAPDPSDPISAYAEGKRVSELLCAIASREHGLETKIARCFAFAGPYAPLDAHFAIGNFLRDAMAGGPIRIKGDGTPWRSYLYAADLATWLWTVLFRGVSNRPYNVGSGEAVTIAQTAAAVAAAVNKNVRVEAAQVPVPGQPARRYVPSVQRAAAELGLAAWTSLPEAIQATAAWHRQRAAV